MVELGDVVVGEVLVGEVVLVGLVVVLPGVHGLATVVEVPAGADGLAEATVELEPPAVVLGEVEAVVLPMLVSLEGVQGATVVVVPLVPVALVPVVPPVALPVLPVLGTPEDVPIELEEGCDVGSVPTVPVEVVPEGVDVVPDGVDVVPCGVEVVPGAVEVVPGEVEVVPDGVDVVVPVCGPMPGLGVTVPVLCAAAIPRDNANADEANKILRIEPHSSVISAAKLLPQERYFASKSS